MVIDSHVLYWWLDGHPKLSKKAEEVFQRAPGEDASIRISAVTFWEFALKERLGKFSARHPVNVWPGFISAEPWLEIVDTDSSIWLAAVELDWKHRDPADRIIAATALAHGVPVLTKDRAFHQQGCPVEAVW